MELCEWQSVLRKQADGSKRRIPLSACLRQPSGDWSPTDQQQLKPLKHGGLQMSDQFFSPYNLQYKCCVFVTVVGHSVIHLFSVSFWKMFLYLHFFFHSCSTVTGRTGPAASTVWTTLRALHHLSSRFSFLRRHVRACWCFRICRSDENLPSCIPLSRCSTVRQWNISNVWALSLIPVAGRFLIKTTNRFRKKERHKRHHGRCW